MERCSAAESQRPNHTSIRGGEKGTGVEDLASEVKIRLYAEEGLTEVDEDRYVKNRIGI